MTKEKPLTINDVHKVITDTHRAGVNTYVVQNVVMRHGGKITLPSGDESPSLKALPATSYAACVAELKELSNDWLAT